MIAALAFAVLLLSASPAWADPVSITAAITAAIKATFSLAGIVKMVIGTVISFALSAVSSALVKKPKAPDFSRSAVDRTVTVRQPLTPWRAVYGEARVGGAITFLHTTNGNNHLHLVITLCGHEVDSIGDIYLDDEIVPLDGNGNATGRFAGYVRVKKALGTANQAAHADLIAEAGDKWTADHRQRGHANLYIRLAWNQDLFANGIPNITAVVKGKKVYDPRTATTAWSNNAALCIADYLTDAVRGVGVSYVTGIDETDLIAAANACDENVTLAGGGTEARYACNGSFETAEKPRDIVGKLLTSMHGRAIRAQGRWSIAAGVYSSPAITLTESDLRGPLRVSSRLSRRDVFNGAKGVYVSPTDNWQPTDFPAIAPTSYLTEDGGQRVWKDIELPFTTSVSMAQRLARVELRKVRQQITVSAQCKLGAYRLAVGDTVGLTNARMGWNSKAFEVTDVRLALVDEGGGPALGVDLSLRETASSIYDWTIADEVEVDPAPDTDLPNPFDVAKPTALTLSSGDADLLLLGEGSVISRIRAAWTAAADARAVSYEVQWKKAADATWSSAVVGAATEFYVSPAEDGAAYDVRVRSISGLGVRSDWELVAGHVVVGKSEPPPRPDSFTVVRLADGTRRFSWTQSPLPADVRAGGGWRIRYLTGTSTDWSAMVPLHEGLLTASPWEINELDAGTWSFGIKTVDSSGNESTLARFVTVALGLPRLRDVILQQLEHQDGWPGTKTNCFLDDNGALRAVSNGNWNNLGSTWSNLAATWDELLTNASPITYTTAAIDLEADLSFTPRVTVVANGTATVTVQLGTSADGAPVGSYAAPAAVTGKRYVRVKVEVTGSTPSITSMSILIDGETTTELFDDVNTASSSASWFSSVAAGHFKIGSKGGLASITTARIVAVQNVGSGWSWSLISKSQTVNGEPAAEFKLWNGSGTLSNATVDVELRGPSV